MALEIHDKQTLCTTAQRGYVFAHLPSLRLVHAVFFDQYFLLVSKLKYTPCPFIALGK